MLNQRKPEASIATIKSTDTEEAAQIAAERRFAAVRYRLGQKTVNHPIEPVKQDRNDKNGRTCTVAVAINDLKILQRGVRSDSITDVLSKIGDDATFNESGELRLSIIERYLSPKGLYVTDIKGHPQILLRRLLEGDAAYVRTPSANGNKSTGHVKLIGGVIIEGDSVDLIIYDPDPNAPESNRQTIEDHLREVYRQSDTAVRLLSRRPVNSAEYYVE